MSEEERANNWIKDQLMKSATGQAQILAKLESNERHVRNVKEQLIEVVDATREFPALKIDVDVLKQVEAARQIKRVKDLEEKLAKKEQADITNKTKWMDRAYNGFMKALPFLIIAAMYLYTKIKESGFAA